MILQALKDYYDRLRGDPDIIIPEPGFSVQGVHFCLVLNPEGKLMGDPIDLRGDGNPKYLIVPRAVKRSSDIAANFLWDNTGYVLGADDRGNPDRTLQTFNAFKSLQHAVGERLPDEGMRAVLRYLDAWDPGKASDLALWDEMSGLNIVFKLDGDLAYIHDRPAIKTAWKRYHSSTGNQIRGMCLVSGQQDAPISRVHAAIRGVPGTQTSGASITSFNLPSFTSYGKTQNLNAPVGEEAAFAYTTALNHLLARNSLQKIQIGDACTVFWTDSASSMEVLMGGLLDPTVLEKAPDHLQNELRILLETISSGSHPKAFEQPDNRFFILGLSPNAARISVRFWHVSTVEEISMHLGRHYRNLILIKNFDTEPDHPGLWQILRETAAQKDTRNISPVLSGQMMRSMLTGRPYPRTILSAMVGRIRADKQINYLRASMIKAYLINNHQMEVAMSLDTGSTDQAYRLGRLFAVLEKAQEEAVSGASATIKDRYFGAASATPARVFPFLLRGVQNNIAKLRKGAETGGRSVYFDRLISEIMDGIDAFRPSLRLEEQGMFSLGYYHQRKDLFTKKSESEVKEAYK